MTKKVMKITLVWPSMLVCPLPLLPLFPLPLPLLPNGAAITSLRVLTVLGFFLGTSFPHRCWGALLSLSLLGQVFSLCPNLWQVLQLVPFHV